MTNRLDDLVGEQSGRSGSGGSKPRIDQNKANELRVEYNRGGITQSALAWRHGLSLHIVERVLRNQTWIQ